VVAEYRNALAPLLGHRIEVRGVLTEIRNDYKGTRGCIGQPEYEGEVAASHVWVIGLTEDWPLLEGQQVVFTAVVRSYQSNTTGRNYCLGQPSALRAVNPPALKIPNPVEEDRPMDSTVHTNQAMPAPAQDMVLGWLCQAKRFALECGGAAQALRILDCLPNLPVAKLKDYLDFLKDEFPSLETKE
jgi:hypothetical protein